MRCLTVETGALNALAALVFDLYFFSRYASTAAFTLTSFSSVAFASLTWHDNAVNSKSQHYISPLEYIARWQKLPKLCSRTLGNHPPICSTALVGSKF